MLQTDLNVKIRTDMGKKSIARNLRKDGFVPAVCYGALKESTPVYVSAKELRAALSTDAKEHILLTMKTDKKSDLNSKIAILKDITKHPIKRDYIHADFLVLDMSKPIKVSIKIKLIGKPKGIQLGGILDIIRREVEVKCLPNLIPEHLDIDISALDIGDSVHVRDIQVPEGVEIMTNGDLTIAVIASPIVEATTEAEEEEAEVSEAEETTEEQS